MMELFWIDSESILRSGGSYRDEDIEILRENAGEIFKNYAHIKYVPVVLILEDGFLRQITKEETI